MDEAKIVSDSQLDQNFRAAAFIENNVAWYSPMENPFHIAGFAWFEQDRTYRRLPVELPYPIPERVHRLANHTAGGQIRFQTDSSFLSVRVKLIGPAYMSHMSAIAQCGIDCYIGDHGEMKFCNASIFEPFDSEYEAVLFQDFSKKMRNIVLNLPLYQGVVELTIGLSTDAQIIEAPPYKSNKKVIIYGTSITQGGCASRPGMAYTNILSRKIPYEFINLGFSGQGKGEPELARTIALIDNPALIVLDYEGNCVSTELFMQTLTEFVRIIRETHPLVPILIPSRIRYPRENLMQRFYDWRTERKKFEQELVAERRKNGGRVIFFHDGSEMLGETDFHECTVDGSHPTDLGFIRMADGLEPVYKALLI